MDLVTSGPPLELRKNIYTYCDIKIMYTIDILYTYILTHINKLRRK